jgi:hypothetical protein
LGDIRSWNEYRNCELDFDQRSTVCPGNKIPKYPVEKYRMPKIKRCMNIKIRSQNQTDVLYS